MRKQTQSCSGYVLPHLELRMSIMSECTWGKEKRGCVGNSFRATASASLIFPFAAINLLIYSDILSF